MKKKMKITLTVLLVVVMSFVMTMLASAVVSVEMAVSVGRSTVVVSHGLTTSFETLSDGANVTEMFCVPIIINETTYVPFRFAMEKMGVSVNYASDTKTTVLTRANPNLTKDNQNLSMLDASWTLRKYKSVEINGTTATFTDADGIKTTEPIDLYNHFGMTYVPVRYLQRFGAVVKWDAKNSIVYISYEDTDAFINRAGYMFAMADEKMKQEAIDRHFEEKTSKDSFKNAMKQYLEVNTESFNNQNGGYISSYNGKTYYPNINIQKDGWYTKIGENARQLCYASDRTENFMYYVDRTEQKLRRTALNSSDAEKDKAVELPAELNGKKITHISSYDGNLFFVAYDNINDGGHIYMSKVGNEKNTTIRITKDNAWNYYVSPTYKLYFVNFTEGYRLSVIDLRALDNINTFIQSPSGGALSDIVNFTPMQSFAFDCSNSVDYYYVDIQTGSLFKSSINHNTATEKLLEGTPETLRSFLNVQNTYGDLSVLFVEYPTGKKWEFGKCKIIQYNLGTKTQTSLYTMDFPVNGLCVHGNEIYFTDTTYSKLYKLKKSGSKMDLSDFS